MDFDFEIEDNNILSDFDFIHYFMIIFLNCMLCIPYIILLFCKSCAFVLMLLFLKVSLIKRLVCFSIALAYFLEQYYCNILKAIGAFVKKATFGQHNTIAHLQNIITHPKHFVILQNKVSMSKRKLPLALCKQRWSKCSDVLSV